MEPPAAATSGAACPNHRICPARLRRCNAISIHSASTLPHDSKGCELLQLFTRIGDGLERGRKSFWRCSHRQGEFVKIRTISDSVQEGFAHRSHGLYQAGPTIHDGSWMAHARAAGCVFYVAKLLLERCVDASRGITRDAPRGAKDHLVCTSGFVGSGGICGRRRVGQCRCRKLHNVLASDAYNCCPSFHSIGLV